MGGVSAEIMADKKFSIEKYLWRFLYDIAEAKKDFVRKRLKIRKSDKIFCQKKKTEIYEAIDIIFSRLYNIEPLSERIKENVLLVKLGYYFKQEENYGTKNGKGDYTSKEK